MEASTIPSTRRRAHRGPPALLALTLLSLLPAICVAKQAQTKDNTISYEGDQDGEELQNAVMALDTDTETGIIEDPMAYIASYANASSSFLEVASGSGSGSGTGLVRAYCEVCILIMQMKERGMPHLCDGYNPNYYITCVQNLESLLRADKALVYWLKNGCMHLDAEGPEIVRPCPALSVCSWVPNLFAQPPSVVRDGIEALCPKDPKFLPKIPEEFAVRATQPTSLPMKPVG
mmetsp:Transcript_17093/g.30624  ORF Transcript_17093/g.30624 Transcript_17093/m.30624 type:complete len:233 (-) Transcript_17093:187-885(-)